MTDDFSTYPEFLDILQNNVSETPHLKCKKWGDHYRIVSYKKEALKDNYTYGVFRSVILNKDNQVVSVSPFKTAPFNRLDCDYIDVTSLRGEEFVEGTMINLFYDQGVWEIATRGTVGARTKFYVDSEMTFRDMFFEACEYARFDVNTLPTKYCFSFVLQHPCNQIVQIHNQPRLYVVDAFEINGLSVSHINVRDHHWFPRSIRYPKIYNDSVSNLMQKFANAPYEIMGVMFRVPGTTIRCKVRNNNYEMVRHLRGNEPNPFFLYLSLLKSHSLQDFLRYFPHQRVKFSKYREQINQASSQLFHMYHECFVKKAKHLKEYDFPFKSHMYALHELYKNELKPNSKFVTFQTVHKFVLGLEPKAIQHLITKTTVTD